MPTAKIIRWSKAPDVKLLVCLVGVQTNQFPRAMDMAKIFRAEGITVIMGGFHTSGTINMLSDQEPDIQELYREGICIVSGEVEGKWEGILADYLHGRLKPLYSFAQDLQNLVDIEDAPLPQTSAKTMEHFAYPSFATADTSRGCPFACTFCTIINVQGRKMRERSPQSIAAMMRRNYLDHGLSFYFFTDDNFARKKLWRETFEEIIKLREEGLDVSFMMQVDLAKKAEGLCSLWPPKPAAPRCLSAWRASIRKTSKPKARNRTRSKSTAALSRNGTTPACWCTPATSSACRGIRKRKSPRTFVF